MGMSDICDMPSFFVRIPSCRHGEVGMIGCFALRCALPTGLSEVAGSQLATNTVRNSLYAKVDSSSERLVLVRIAYFPSNLAFFFHLGLQMLCLGQKLGIGSVFDEIRGSQFVQLSRPFFEHLDDPIFLYLDCNRWIYYSHRCVWI